MATKNNINWEFSEPDEDFDQNKLAYVLKMIEKTGFLVNKDSQQNFDINKLEQATHYTKEELHNYFNSVNKIDKNEVSLKNYISFGLYDIASSSILSAYNTIEDNDRSDFISEIIASEQSSMIEPDVDWSEKEIVQISDLDVTQKTAIANSLSRSQFIWGPPGTGKSETIVNLLANIIFRNQRALFITEKKVASDVVYDRMKDLKDFCLMLFHKTEGVQFHEQVKKIHNKIQEEIDKQNNHLSNSNLNFQNYGEKIDSYIDLAKEYKNHFTIYTGKYYLLSVQHLKNKIEKFSFENKFVMTMDSYECFEELQSLNDKKLSDKFNIILELFKDLDIKKIWEKRQYLEIYNDDYKRKVFYFNHYTKQKYKTKLGIFAKKKYEQFLSTQIQNTNYESFCEVINFIDNITFSLIFKMLYCLTNQLSQPLINYNFDYLCAMYINDHKKRFARVLNNANSWIDAIRETSKNRFLNDLKLIYQTHLEQIAFKIKQSSEKGYEGVAYAKLFRNLGNAIGIRKQIRLTTYFKNYIDLLKLMFPIIITNPNNAANNNFLKLVEKEFDFTIFDEASQIFVEKCIPALYRAKNYIIVGDDKQLPPTNFFSDKLNSDEIDIEQIYQDPEEQNFINTESLIDFANSRYPKNMLQYHYRSFYTELINFSNAKYYESKLLVVNKNQRSFLPIEVISTSGNFEDGVNVKEAHIVVKLILELLKDQLYQNKTIGVITFNSQQKKLIDSLIEKEAEHSTSLQNILNLQKGEELFVKNIENVQGDERDIIIFSIAFAPKNDGKFINNYGPLNNEGGERRLNVAITRAKEKMIIVKSIHSSVMNPNKKGAIDLRDFLYYSELLQNKETVEQASQTILKNNYNDQEFQLEQFDSDFEVEVFNELQRLIAPYSNRYELRNQTKTAGYRIDITVLDKEKNEYVLAIECDGYKYHSSDFDRKKDIDRQYYLEKRGWKFARILSTDWWSKDKTKRNEFLEKVMSYLK
ncbi:hypothetical protein SHELI_v1c04720 [Spiroplasma helicoides]|uniref:RAP domain-containing protein n=2 Tax=Spiroplasma helicoides TaxID=216938 RepID=A0A1B3SKG7_9MOLU|nr:hypothetical protein SHELI_v1c04720 [Spiroplasma helicoides]